MHLPKVTKVESAGQDWIPGFVALQPLYHTSSLNKVQGLLMTYSGVFLFCFVLNACITLGKKRPILSPPSSYPLRLYPKKVSAEMKKVIHKARVD